MCVVVMKNISSDSLFNVSPLFNVCFLVSASASLQKTASVTYNQETSTPQESLNVSDEKCQDNLFNGALFSQLLLLFIKRESQKKDQ